MLGGDLATDADSTLRLPDLVARWLTKRGWRQQLGTWDCGNHPARLRL